MNRLPPTSPARRHFMSIVAAGAGRLSTIAVAASLLSVTKTKKADAMGLFPWDDPNAPNPHCFARGTLIRTPDGEVPVENLAIGAMVMTTSGALPVKWVGQQAMVRNASASWHPGVVPVRVARFAIDDQTPHRDLYLSQEHCLYIDGVLIPVKYLVNGHSIAFDDDAMMSEAIEYFCVELDTHEVIFAEGTAVETFRHWGGQIAWDNLGDYQDLYGTEHGATAAFAPICRYAGGRAAVGGLLRLAASRVVDVRDPIQVAYDRIAARALAVAA